MKRSVVVLTVCGLFNAWATATDPVAPLAPGQWTTARARAWHDAQPWLVGCNFLPSTAVNDVEMWQAATFDRTTIERELGWARDLGFNSVRVFLNFVVWEADADGLRQRFERLLGIADRLGISVMPVLFDDCNFAGRVAAAGPQPDPVPGVHNSQWVSSPPLAMVTDPSTSPRLERYVTDLVGTFAGDRRVVVWDLYNEPGNSGLDARSQPLMEAAFTWARAARPSQPLTVGAWADFTTPLSRRMMALSDVVSFHGYDGRDGMEAKLAVCAAYGRPVLCTEWLRRQAGNRFETLLPLFRDRRIGSYDWGLVAGRTQTYFPWGSPAGAAEPRIWQHDIFRADGRPFSLRETTFIKTVTGRLPSGAVAALPRPQVVVPTAEAAPTPWRYTVAIPAADWFKPGFDDAGWTPGMAPFGRGERPIARRPNTIWTNAEIWLRRDFDWPAGGLTEVALRLHHDEDTEVYLNGVAAAQAAGYNADYESFGITPEAQATLKPGRNLLAAHVRQTAGGQYFDLGIEATSGVAGAWQMRPFIKRAQPVLAPNPDSRFRCPVLDREVRWEEQNVYNPAAVVRQRKVYLLYRADDRNPGLKWGRTCRIGMAWSDDGLHFTRHPTPVLHPDNDEWKQYEWEGGCEDLHIAESEDGTYYLNYTTWSGSSDTLSVASSRDLVHWTKHGPAFRKAGATGGRSGVVVSRQDGDRLIAARINGRFWMYYTHPCALAWSENLIDWTPTGQAVWPGGGREAGAIALLRDDGILLLTQGGHATLGAWTLRQTLIDRHDLITVLKDQPEPFLHPELEWERRGFIADTVVANGLVPFHGDWLLYYGAADRWIGLATLAGSDLDGPR